ncbi:MAG: hypothetical protein R3357_03465 [Burkholderiales bacterium]|nr:hypothetical protein [Burkholderiales bacterium]
MTGAPPTDPLLEQRCWLSEDDCIELRLARATRGLAYRLAFLRDGECLLRYEHGPGQPHARTLRGRTTAYAFRSVEQLRYDFERDVEAL